MPNLVIRKLEPFARLSEDDKRALEAALSERVRRVEPRIDVVCDGDRPDHVGVVLSGWACRYRQLEDGRRQIISYALPGDMCDLNVYILRHVSHSLATITSCTYAELSRDTLEALTAAHPRVLQGFWWDTLVNASIQRERTVSLGQRSAFERLAHLCCELFVRLRAVGLTDGDACPFPVTQADLADTNGVSAVHVSRVLKDLRRHGLIALHGRTLTIPNLPALMEAARFTPDYLHLDHAGRHLDAAEA